MTDDADWTFPLPRTHCGILLGNARLGVMLWGGGDTLNITLGRADLWDHRGGMPWSPEHTFVNLRTLLESNNEAGLRELFRAPSSGKPGEPAQPSVIPIGRLELRLPVGAQLKSGKLHFAEGRIVLTAQQNGNEVEMTCELPMQDDLLLLQLPAGWQESIFLTDRPATETTGEALRKLSFPEPQAIREADVTGWWQALPADPGVCVLHRRLGNTLLIRADRAAAPDDARNHAQRLAAVTAPGLAELRAGSVRWWEEYWRDVPEIALPNPRLQLLYQYGMYKFAGLSQPGGFAAPLQGPWVEEYQLPPWSNDYHFNINVQMCYWPAFRGNRLTHLRPLFDLVLGWEGKLRAIARTFAGVEDGRMLPHAVDDRCTPMGGFWTGMIDHACTAWVAQMMYDYARFAPDPVFLRDKAFPFMRGTFAVYAAMLEERDGRYHLPVSVSPEYGGCGMNAWGRNASFQLAALHRLCRNLLDASQTLGLEPDPLWRKVDETLPPASLAVRGGKTRIALWDGKELDESHRHHSHLGGLYPFDTFDLREPATRELVADSVMHWIYKGPGLWTGWCMPWAAILHARLGNGEMAELLLEIWEKVFTNEGRGTLHDFNFPGFTLMGGRQPLSAHTGRPEIMQMDAGMGVTGAILELLVQEQCGVHYVFRGIPANWRDCSFRGLRAAGGFLLNAERKGGQLRKITIRATADGTFALAHPLVAAAIPGAEPAAAVRVRTPAGSRESRESVLTLSLRAGEEAEILPAN